MIGNSNLIVNRDAPPFDNADIRMALALTLDRKSFNDIMNEGVPGIGAVLLPPPDGVWGVPPDMLATFPGYGPDVTKNRGEARALMRKAGYGPDKRLKVKIFTRDTPTFRDPALILADHLKEIYVDAELDVVDTTLYYNRVVKKDYSVGMNATGTSLDDPDQAFYEFFGCGSLRNYTNYCNREIQGMIDQQSQEIDPAKRKSLVWEIERRLAQDVARPITYHSQQAGCWQGYVKNFDVMTNSIYNGWRWGDEVAAIAGVVPLGLLPCRRTAAIIDPSPFDAENWPMLIDIDESWYARPEARTRLMVSPADQTPSYAHDIQPDEIDIAIGIDRMQQALDIPVRRVEHSWAGLRTFTPDGSLAFGWDAQAEGFFWSVGQGGYGIQTAPAAGRLVTDLVLGRDPGEAAAIVSLVDPRRYLSIQTSSQRQPL